MPAAALKAVPSAEVLPLNALAPRLIELSNEQAEIEARRAV
jgi:hypothetical protein